MVCSVLQLDGTRLGDCVWDEQEVRCVSTILVARLEDYGFVTNGSTLYSKIVFAFRDGYASVKGEKHASYYNSLKRSLGPCVCDD